MSEEVAAPVELPPRRRRRWPWLSGAIVLAVAVITTLLVQSAVRDEGYGPLVSGAAGGTSGPGLGDRNGHPVLRSGAGPVYLLSMLDNDGTHDVRVRGVGLDDTIRAARWAPYRPEAGMVFTPKHWRAFPAVVPGRGTIQVRLTIGRPLSCRHFKPGDGIGLSFSGGYDVTWDSRRSEHMTSIEGDAFGGGAVQLC